MGKLVKMVPVLYVKVNPAWVSMLHVDIIHNVLLDFVDGIPVDRKISMFVKNQILLALFVTLIRSVLRADVLGNDVPKFLFYPFSLFSSFTNILMSKLNQPKHLYSHCTH